MRNSTINMLLFCMFVTIVVSCTSRDNTEHLTAINETLVNASHSIMQENENIYAELNDKLLDAHTKQMALIWNPKALDVKNASAEVVSYIDLLLSDINKEMQTPEGDSVLDNERSKELVELFIKQNKLEKELFQKIIKYRDHLSFSVDSSEFNYNPVLQRDVSGMMKSLHSSIPVSVFTDQHLKKYLNTPETRKSFFEGNSRLEATLFLNKLKYDVAKSENDMIRYFNSLVNSNFDGYTQLSGIVSLNSSYLKRGQTLEITAGIVVSFRPTKTTISINGAGIAVNSDGLGSYRKIITDTPGKYFIKVHFEYIKPDGSSAYLDRNVEYIVSE